MGTGRRPALTLAVGGAILAAALVVVLQQAPPRILGSNGVRVIGTLTPLGADERVCELAEQVPAGTTAIRISSGAYIGPPMTVTLFREGRVIASGQRGAGWVQSSLTFPLRPRVRAPVRTTLCVKRGGGGLAANLFGGRSPPALAAYTRESVLGGRMRVEYLAPGKRSWLSRARYLARRLGLGRIPSGGFIVLPLVAMMALAAALAGWLLLRLERHG